MESALEKTKNQSSTSELIHFFPRQSNNIKIWIVEKRCGQFLRTYLVKNVLKISKWFNYIENNIMILREKMLNLG